MIFKAKSYINLIPLLIICLYSLYLSYSFELHDFANYYFGGCFLNKGLLTTNIYFPYYFNHTVADLGYGNFFLSFAPNTPFLAILFSPFALIPISLSKFFFNCLSIILLMISVIRLQRVLEIKKEYLLIFPLVFFIPIRNNILFGQLYFVLLFLLSEGYIAYKNKSYWKMALFWGFSIMLKVFPLILFGFLLFKKEYKALAFLCVGTILLLFLSLGLTDFSIWNFYLFNVLNRANNGEIAGAFVDNYQSVYMFLKRLFVYDSLENKTAIYSSPILFKTLVYLFKIGVLILLYHLSKLKENNFYTCSFWLLGGLLASAYGSTYSLLLLVFLYFSISKIEIQKQVKWLLILGLFFISNIPFSKLSFGFPFNYFRLFLLIILFAFIFYQYRELVKFKITIAVLIIFGLVLPFILSKDINYKNVLNISTPILTYNYDLSDNTITYNYWNEKGKNSVNVPFEFNSIETLELKNNQIFYGQKQLTFDHGNKLKPILVDDKFILFLSDLNRGIGFYDLKKIDLD